MLKYFFHIVVSSSSSCWVSSFVVSKVSEERNKFCLLGLVARSRIEFTTKLEQYRLLGQQLSIFKEPWVFDVQDAISDLSLKYFFNLWKGLNKIVTLACSKSENEIEVSDFFYFTKILNLTENWFFSLIKFVRDFYWKRVHSIG